MKKKQIDQYLDTALSADLTPLVGHLDAWGFTEAHRKSLPKRFGRREFEAAAVAAGAAPPVGEGEDGLAYTTPAAGLAQAVFRARSNLPAYRPAGRQVGSKRKWGPLASQTLVRRDSQPVLESSETLERPPPAPAPADGAAGNNMNNADAAGGTNGANDANNENGEEEEEQEQHEGEDGQETRIPVGNLCMFLELDEPEIADMDPSEVENLLNTKTVIQLKGFCGQNGGRVTGMRKAAIISWIVERVGLGGQ
jgi:hypothetical protein